MSAILAFQLMGCAEEAAEAEKQAAEIVQEDAALEAAEKAEQERLAAQQTPQQQQPQQPSGGFPCAIGSEIDGDGYIGGIGETGGASLEQLNGQYDLYY